MNRPLAWMSLAAALAAASPAPGEPPSSPLFAPDPPEPAAAALVEAYLPLLAAGEFEQALALNDQRSMRQYLLDQRLNDLKAKTPELTAQDLEEMSAQLQLNELNPARLRNILLGLMREAGYENMTWSIRGYAPTPGPLAGHLVGIDVQSLDGAKKPMLLAIKKLGDQWLVAPDVLEALAKRQAAVRKAASAEPPGEVVALVDAFWHRWQNGELNEAHALFGETYRSRVPLLAFLQQAQDFVAKIGAPTNWSVVRGVEPAPHALWLGVTVQGPTAAGPTLMLFKKNGPTWTLEDLQLQMPGRPGSPGPVRIPQAPAPRTDFRTDLKPSLDPMLPTTVPKDPVELPAATAPAKPDAPIGPDLP
ncbi:MAG: hypothetical protein AB7V14_02970 [Kiritimatiellia bacterium]